MENETDVIRNQMLETRTSLTEKLEALQETVVTAVQGTTESVTETVQNVKEAVQETVSNVSETVQETVDTVKSTFDISHQVEKHPWAMMGGAVALGYVGGKLLPSAGTVAHAASSAAHSAAGAVSGAAAANVSGSHFTGSNFSSSGGVPQPSQGGYQAPSSAHSMGSSLLSGLTEAINPLVTELEGLAIGTLTGMLGQMALEHTPENLRSQVKEFIEKVNTTLGGKPVQWTNNSSSPGSYSSQHGHH